MNIKLCKEHLLKIPTYTTLVITCTFRYETQRVDRFRSSIPKPNYAHQILNTDSSNVYIIIIKKTPLKQKTAPRVTQITTGKRNVISVTPQKATVDIQF